jgi:uncharacterized protein YdbL (DUF1318 family)
MNKTEVKALVAKLNEARNARLKLDNESKKLKVIEDTCMDQLVAAQVVSGQYGPYLIEAQFKKVPRCTDWEGFYAYLRETGNLDMLTKHLTASAIVARLDEGEYVAGIVVDTKHTYKISAA